MKHYLLLSICIAISMASSANADLINEWEPNPVGTDPANQDIELLGTALADFNLWILSIEGEGITTPGLVDEAFNVMGTYDADGRAVVSVGNLENPTNTLLLTDTFTGVVDVSDIDADDDGTADGAFWGEVMDAIGITDGEGSTVNYLYGAQLGGADFAFTGDEPGLVFRDSVTQDWYAINDPAGTDAFDINGNTVAFSQFNQDPSFSTFGSVNPFVTPIPEPSSVVIGGLFLTLGLVRRRK